MFGFKKKEKEEVVKKRDDSIDLIGESENTDLHSEYSSGMLTAKDCFAPDCISVVDEKTLLVGEKYVRNYVMQGYPNFAYVGWLDKLYSYSGDLDTIVYVEPTDDRKATDDLTKQITALRSQLQIEMEKGSIANITKYQQRIAQLEQERAAIEMNSESLYHVGIFSNLLCNSKEELDKKAEMLEASMKGQRINFIPTSLRMLDGFKTALPTMYTFYDDKLRNFNTGGVVGCFPFYNSEICHPGGLFLGINSATNTPLYVNFYDKHAVNNTNISVFGRAGSGKTFFVSLMTMRSALQGVHTAIIDPEGEYKQIAMAMGGINIEIRPGSRSFINAFDVEEAQEVDDEGKLTGEVFVDVNGKIADLLDLISVMAQGEITQEQRSLVSSVIQTLYKNFGITEDPDSLYEGEEYDEATGRLYNGGKRKKMPTFSDFHNLLVSEIKRDKAFEPLQRLANQLQMFKKGGPYDLFDNESTIDVGRISSVPIVNFNVSQLEESVLRPIGMYVAMTYIWEKFVKRNFKIRKRVVCDEAWMMLNQSMSGHEYTAAFLEKCARRIRKRNAGLLVASQNFIEFSSCNEGKSVLSNTAVRIFLKQSETDLHAVQEEFNLSDGETEFLRTSDIGEFLLKTDNEATVAVAVSCTMERDLLTKKNAVQQR